MASSIVVLCSLCEQRNLSEPASVYCPECMEALCNKCQKSHILSMFTKVHGTISVDDYQTLPPFISEIKRFCDEHKQQYDMFCPAHDVVCCRKCLINFHADCRRIKHLREIVRNVRQSSAVIELDQTLNQLLDFIKELRNEREQNKSNLIADEENIRTKIKLVRKNINEHLDKIEKQLLDEMSEITNVHIQKIDDLLCELDNKEKIISQIQSNSNSMKKYASDFQVFLGTKKLEMDLAKEEQQMISLCQDSRVSQVDLQIVVDPLIESLTNNVSNFGRVSDNMKPTNVSLKPRKERQAQIAVSSVNNIDNIQLKPTHSFNVQEPSCRFHGCALLSDGRMVFADYGIGNRLHVLNADGSFLCHIRVNPTVYAVTCIDENIIACTSYSRGGALHIVDIQNRTVDTVLGTVLSSSGITYSSGKIFYTPQNKRLEAYDMSNKKVNAIPISSSSIDRVASWKDRIYFSSVVDSSVHCIDMSGKEIWKFKNSNRLKKPGDFAIDKNGNVYIIDQETSNVTVLAGELKQCKQILSETDGLIEPTAIHCERNTNRLILCSRKGTVWLYDII